MTEPFKHLINAATVSSAALHLGRAWPAFDRSAFEARALAGLEALEMKARAMQLAGALEATLPADFDAAAGIIERALAPPLPEGDGIAVRADDAHGLAGWVVWPLGEFVARRGMAQPERALAALHALTQRFSAEFAIRPFIVRHPAMVFGVLARWVHDPSAHVRRLVSEGSRPRLPWGQRLNALVADPSPTLPLLRALQDDASAYVRRSVANHLNDIAKDHPGIVEAWLARWLPGAPPERAALLRHASRTLIKQGDAAVLAHWGVGRAFAGRATLTVAPPVLMLGGTLQLRAELHSRGDAAQPLEIDLLLHMPGADGRERTKVFKGWRRTIEPGATLVLERALPLRPVTTRRHHAGPHRITLQVNGVPGPAAGFELRLPKQPAPSRS